MGILARVQEVINGWLLPLKARTVRNGLYEPSALAQRMDVDGVLAVLRQAESGDTENLFALYRDVIGGHAHAQTELMKRKLAVLGDPLGFQAAVKDDPVQETAAAFVKAQIEACPGWLRACGHLLDASIWPVAVLEKLYRVSNKPGVRYELAKLIPVPSHLLDYSEGELKIWDCDERGQRLGTKHDPDPARYIVHRGHLLSTPDNWGGPMRALLFWYLFSVMDREWWARFLDRFGAPFIVAKYNQADDQTRAILHRALSRATKTFGLVVSTDTHVELEQAATSQAGDAFEKFHAVANREISKLILGQTLSSEAQNTGLGSGVAKGQSDVRQDYRQFDAAMLAETLQDNLARQILLINGVPGDPPALAWASESADEAELTGKLLGSLNQAGLQVADDALPVLSQRLGLQVERIPAPATPPQPAWPMPFYALAADPSLRQPGDPRRVVEAAERANDSVVRTAAPALAEAFRGRYSPVRLMILESASPEDLERRIRESYPDHSPTRVAGLIEDALVAHAANAMQVHAART
jgi:phage gp29-like protein